MRSLLPLLVALLLGPACVRSYRDAPPLSFRDFPYTSLAGEAWPEKLLALPRTAERHGMARVPAVTYVELNPGGTGRPLVFVHGLGSYLKFWRYQLDAFAQAGHRVVALDMLGYGKSEKPASFPYTMEAMGDVVHELVQALGLERPVLVGHSMGGQTALSYALRYPQDVSALVLTAPAGFEPFSPREQEWFRRAVTRQLIGSASEYGIWGSVRQANFQRWRPELEWLIEERVRVARSPEFDSYAHAQVRSVQGLAANDFVRESLEKVAVPTLVVFGEDDRLIPNPFLHGGRARSVFEPAARRIPGAQLVGLDGCGHSVQLDCPEEYNAALTRFLGSLPR